MSRVWTPALLCLSLGCTDVFIEPRSAVPTNTDDRLSLTGRVCTAPPDPSGFPVKVVLVVDQSGSMCISDPPGSQETSGFCQMYSTVPPGVTEPARVRALRRLIQQFEAIPNVQVSLVPFETNVKGPWPQNIGMAQSRFARPDGDLFTRVGRLQAELGKGTDYQGALSYAYGVVASDIDLVEQNNPELLPRTRYVVVFLTDGTPFPRCSANDNLSVYADDQNPDLTWADSLGAGDFCNQIDPEDPDAITGFVKGTDRNQNYQLFSYVDQLVELKQQHNIGDIRLHTVLLFNEESVRNCGPICQDIYGQYPNVQPAQYPEAAHNIARHVLGRLAERGNGVFQEFLNGDIQNMGLGALDYSSLSSRNVMKTLLATSLSAVPGDVDREVDTDGDGLPDTLDTEFAAKTNMFFPDTDGDCFDDNFEATRRDLGFRPDVKDSRGCDPLSPLTPECACRDTDGDGLSQFAEAYLKTRPQLADTDGDGIPDGMEVRYGLDPLTPQGVGLDTDGDGIADLNEFRAESNPIKRDTVFNQKNAYQYETTPEVQADGRICYDFNVSNLQMVVPKSAPGKRQGYNLFKLYFSEAPESGVASDYGVWKAACAWAQYDPPVRNPAGPEIAILNSEFQTLTRIDEPSEYASRCVNSDTIYAPGQRQ